jgi:pimeloyl-ACP methyl ester carboxylesterase
VVFKVKIQIAERTT